jgi:hypothetical protein
MLGPQKRRRHIERVRQDLPIPDPKGATVKGDQAPLVEVGTDAIGVFVYGVELQGLSVFRYGQSGTGPLIAWRGERQPQPMRVKALDYTYTHGCIDIEEDGRVVLYYFITKFRTSASIEWPTSNRRDPRTHRLSRSPTTCQPFLY